MNGRFPRTVSVGIHPNISLLCWSTDHNFFSWKKELYKEVYLSHPCDTFLYGRQLWMHGNHFEVACVSVMPLLIRGSLLLQCWLRSWHGTRRWRSRLLWRWGWCSTQSGWSFSSCHIFCMFLNLKFRKTMQWRYKLWHQWTSLNIKNAKNVVCDSLQSPIAFSQKLSQFLIMNLTTLTTFRMCKYALLSIGPFTMSGVYGGEIVTVSQTTIFGPCQVASVILSITKRKISSGNGKWS